MIFIEIGLTITAFKRGWRWRALWPIRIVAGMAFLISSHMGLACTASSKENDVLVFLNEVTCRKVSEKTNIQLWNGCQIKSLHGLKLPL